MNFKSTHNLPFEVAPWYNPEMTRFRIGTCHGLYFTNGKSYNVLAIENEMPGNGHLQDVFDWFENSAKRDGYIITIMEVWNIRFKKHLIEKRGFKEKKGTLHLFKKVK